MRPELFKRVSGAFAEIAELPPDARAARLAELDAREPEVAAEVRHLLSHDSEDEFLARPALGARVDLWAASTAGATDEDLSGSIVGHYRLVRRLASGGMGTVYLAERADGQFRQRVAVKLIKRGLDTDEVLRRFEHERQTLAALNHESIAKLLDGGATESGRPYLVMEYVEGVPIDRYCRNQSLSAAQRVRLFMRVCEAVQYAHQNLVVHRDIKPQNVLVTKECVPKLVDFGVAKVLGDGTESGLTVEVGTRFTPEYASPEQILGQPVTTATDVYSLGVLLYELLAERPPYVFKTRSPEELRLLVCEQDPPPPSAGAPRTAPGAEAPGEAVTRPRPQLRGDLDRIVLMAMRKEPHRRYSSAEQLAADLGRYLHGRPVNARPNTFGYVAGKFVRRNMAAVIAAAFVVGVMAAGVGGVLWQGRIAERQRDIAVVAQGESEAINKFLDSMLGQADPGQAGPDVRVRDFLDAWAERARQELKDKPAIRASVLGTIARTYLNLGLTDKAEPLMVDVLAYRESVGEEHPRELVGALVDLATLRYQQERQPEAETLLRRGLDVAKSRLGPRHEATATALSNLGPVLRKQGKLDDAEIALKEALAIRKEVLGPRHSDVAETINNLSFVASSRGDLPGAEALLKEALEIREATLPKDHPMVIQALDNLAVIMLHQKKYAEAEPLQAQALERARQRYGPDHPILAMHINNRAFGLVLLKRFAESEPLSRESLAIREKHFGPKNVETAASVGAVSMSLTGLERFEEAESLLLKYWEPLQDERGGEAWEYLRRHLEGLYKAWGRADKQAEYAAMKEAGGGRALE